MAEGLGPLQLLDDGKLSGGRERSVKGGKEGGGEGGDAYLGKGRRLLLLGSRPLARTTMWAGSFLTWGREGAKEGGREGGRTSISSKAFHS